MKSKMENNSMCPVGTKIQSLIIDKEFFDEKEAKEWAKNHDFKYGKLDVKEKSYRFRQLNPSFIRKGTFRTIEITDGVQAVIGCPIPEFENGGDIDTDFDEFKDGSDVVINNSCIKLSTWLLQEVYPVKDWFVLSDNNKLIIVFKKELTDEEVNDVKSILSQFTECHYLLSVETLQKNDNGKSISIDLKHNNVTVGEFADGGGVNEHKEAYNVEQVKDTLRKMYEDFAQEKGYATMSEFKKERKKTNNNLEESLDYNLKTSEKKLSPFWIQYEKNKQKVESEDKIIFKKERKILLDSNIDFSTISEDDIYKLKWGLDYSNAIFVSEQLEIAKRIKKFKGFTTEKLVKLFIEYPFDSKNFTTVVVTDVAYNDDFSLVYFELNEYLEDISISIEFDKNEYKKYTVKIGYSIKNTTNTIDKPYGTEGVKITFEVNEIDFDEFKNTYLKSTAKHFSDSEFSDGGEVQFIEYKDSEIMFEPHNKEYFVGDEQFSSLEDAQEYIDDGSQPSQKTINAYRHGAMKDGGIIMTNEEEKEYTDLIEFKKNLRGQDALDWLNRVHPKYERFSELGDKYIRKHFNFQNGGGVGEDLEKLLPKEKILKLLKETKFKSFDSSEIKNNIEYETETYNPFDKNFVLSISAYPCLIKIRKIDSVYEVRIAKNSGWIGGISFGNWDYVFEIPTLNYQEFENGLKNAVSNKDVVLYSKWNSGGVHDFYFIGSIVEAKKFAKKNGYEEKGSGNNIYFYNPSMPSWKDENLLLIGTFTQRQIEQGGSQSSGGIKKLSKEYANGGGVDVSNYEESLNEMIKKSVDEITRYEELKNKLTDNLIKPYKIIGRGIKPQYARKLAFEYIDENLSKYKADLIYKKNLLSSLKEGKDIILYYINGKGVIKENEWDNHVQVEYINGNTEAFSKQRLLEFKALNTPVNEDSAKVIGLPDAIGDDMYSNFFRTKEMDDSFGDELVDFWNKQKVNWEDEYVTKLRTAGFNDKDIFGILFGYISIYDLKCEREFDFNGVLNQRKEVQMESVDEIIESKQSGYYEAALKYPITIKILIDELFIKYKISETPLVFDITQGVGTSKMYIYKGDGIYIGRVVNEAYGDKKPLDKYDSVNKGYVGIVTDSIEKLYDSINILFREEDCYIKNLNVLYNNLGGIDAKDIEGIFGKPEIKEVKELNTPVADQFSKEQSISTEEVGSGKNNAMENIKLEIQEYFKKDAILIEKLNEKISDSEFSKIQEIRSDNGKKLMKHFVNHFNLEKGQVYEYKQSKESAKYNKLKYMALLAIHMDNFIEFDYFDENLKRVENESYERFYSKDLMKLFDLFSENKITLLNNYNYVKTSEQTGEYQIIAPLKELTEDEKNWASITDKFNQVYFEDSSSENNILTSDQVKASEYAWQFDKYSKYKSTLSWEDAEAMFKKSLTKEELDSIEISYKKEKYSDLEEHDTEKYHKQIFVKQKKEVVVPINVEKEVKDLFMPKEAIVPEVFNTIEVVDSVKDEMQSIKDAIEYFELEAEDGNEEAIGALEYFKSELESLIANIDTETSIESVKSIESFSDLNNPENITGFIYRATGDFITIDSDEGNRVFQVLYSGDKISSIELWGKDILNKPYWIKSWVGDAIGNVFSGDEEIEKYEEGGETLLGGKADYMSLDEIADMHGVALDHILRQSKIGMKVEKEHTNDTNKIVEIVKDHLYENPNYYTKLQEIESSFENGGGIGYYWLDVPNEFKDRFIGLSILKNSRTNSIDNNGFFRFTYNTERELDTAISILNIIKNPNFRNDFPTNLNQLKAFIKVGTILRVSYNKNRPDFVGSIKIVSTTQTNGFYMINGAVLPSVLTGAKQSWLEYPKSSYISFSPFGFTIYYLDKDNNQVKFLQYEYVVGEEEEIIKNMEGNETLTFNESIKMNEFLDKVYKLSDSIEFQKGGMLKPEQFNNKIDYNLDKESVSCFINSKNTGRTLLMRRSSGDYLGTWALLSGGVESGESTEETVKREIQEEMGVELNYDDLNLVNVTKYPNVHYYYEVSVNEEFEPNLNHENDAYVWVNMAELPNNLHPLLEKYFKMNVFA